MWDRRWSIAAVAGLVALPLIAYAPLLDPSRAPADFDAFAYIYPYRHYLALAWSAGRWLPTWNPSIFIGAPLLANIQAAALYPLSLVFLAVPGPSALGWSIVIHLAIAGVGMYAYGMMAARLRLAGSLVAAGAYMLSSHLTIHLGQINQISTLAWTPWLMLAFHRGADRPGRLGVVAIAAVSALTILAGHTQQAYLSFLTAGAAGLLVVGRHVYASRWHTLKLAAATWAGGLALGVGLAAAQLLPTGELILHSYRQGGLSLAAANVEPLPLKGLLGSLLPHYSASLPPEYAGASTAAAVITLAAFGVIVRWRRPEIAFWAVAALVTIWAATGTAGHLFSVLFRVVPGLDLFRAPGRLLLVSTIALALLAGYGVRTIQQLIRARRRVNWTARALAPIGLIAAGWIGVGLLALAGQRPDLVTHRSLRFIPLGMTSHDLVLTLSFAFATVLVCAAAFLVLPRLGGRAAPGIAGLALLALVVGDTWLSTAQFHMHGSVAASLYNDPGAVDSLVQPSDNQRYLSLVTVTDLGNFQRLEDAPWPNIGMGNGRLSADGYDGGLLPTGSYVQFRAPVLPADSGNPPDFTILAQTKRVWSQSWLTLAGVSYVLADRGVDPNPPGCICLQLAGADGDIAIWQVIGTQPTRAWVQGPTGATAARVTSDTGERVAVSIPEGASGQLVLADAYYPGWSAAVDGRSTPISEYDGMLRAVNLPSGSREVIFEYQPLSVRLGVAISLIALVMAGLLIWGGRGLEWSRWLGRRKREGTP
jgi:hypothetical protein